MSSELYSQVESRKKLTVWDITVLAILSALLFVVQAALAFLPNIELVSLLTIIYTLIIGRRTLYTIYIFAILEGLVYGFGIWWFNYLYVWTILFIVVSLLRKNKSVIIWAIISSFFGLSFGFLCAIPYAAAGGLGAGFAWWVAGIPFDVIHGVGNFVVTLLLFKPVYYIISKLESKRSTEVSRR